MKVNGRCSHQVHSDEPLTTLGRSLIVHLGDDPGREGLRDTPQRFAKSLRYLCKGYDQEPEDVIGDALFESPGSDLVVVKDIDFYSLCEHHLLPFFGKAHVAYVPDSLVVGLSKIPRLIDVYARRLQVQERLGSLVAEAFFQIVRPKGVAVALEATHLCMAMRGVERGGSVTQSLTTLGMFQDDGEWNSRLYKLLL